MNEQDSNMAMNSIGHAAQMVQASMQMAAADWSNPSTLFRPTLVRDGNQWCALYGDNLQEGVAGFGDSPALAMAAFDRAWYTPIKREAPPKAQPMSDAAASVLAERQRQISVEGWTPEHDDTHNSCELPAAAACYALCATEQHTEELQINGVRVWPWSRAWWKPKTYRENLVKAGALILAEIERIDRAAERHPKIGE